MTKARTPPRDFAGTMARPPWGYKQWMLAGNRAYFFDRLVRDYGDFVHYRGLFNFYLVNHPSLVKQVLQETQQAFDKRSVIYNRFRNPFGDGLVVAEGERWKQKRDRMQPMFGPITVQRYFPLMIDAATKMADAWEPLCRRQAVFDIAEEMNRITLEVAGRAFFHDGFQQASERISRWTHTINYYSGKPPLPIVRSYWFPSPLNRRLKQALREFHAFMQTMIDQHQAEETQDNLLAILLNARGEGAGAMTDQEIKEEVLGMIIGGHETSSSALTWIWYELHRHPEVEQQLHAELAEVVGNRQLTLEDVPRLPYARMVIEETLRLHPPFWFENRNVAREVELGGVRLTPGSLVLFSRYSLHRHADFWQDPERFNPQRFEPGNEENRRSTYATVPFGGGPRICIGIHFAMLELVVLLATLAQRYRVVADASDRHQMGANLTMAPKYGLRVRLERR